MGWWILLKPSSTREAEEKQVEVREKGKEKHIQSFVWKKDREDEYKEKMGEKRMGN